MNEQRGGARDMEKRDKVRGGKGLQERRPDAERVWGDAAGLEPSGLTGAVRAGRGVAPRRSLGKLRPAKPA